MAFFDTTRPAAHRTEPGILSHLWAEFQMWRETRATRNALAQLSDHELEDIGLSRSDIDTLPLQRR